jgi:pimeloyl-ACP methyl ester carboxylesterase
MAPYRERRLTARDGLSLYYRDYGDPAAARIPLLCLGGLTRNSADFATVAAREAARRRVLCPDYRGRGRSDYDADWRHYDAYVYLDDVAHLLAANDIHRVVVLGTSLGGILAMGLAVLKPTAVAGVVLNDIGPEIADTGFTRVLDYIGTDHPQPNWPAAVEFLRRLLPTLSLASDEEWLDFARATYRQGEDGLLHYDWDINIVKPLGRPGVIPDLWPFFRALRKLPVLALRGEVSDMLSADTFRKMAEVKSDLLCVSVPQCGHVPSLNEPIAKAALDAFLDRF